MGTITTTALYPRTEGKKFDIDYYIGRHLPLAEKIWGPLGMKDWSVVAFKDDKAGNKPLYRYKVVSRWTSIDAIKKATTTAEGKAVLDDAVNYTDEVPIVLVGEENWSKSVDLARD
ncbi:unnamed protein product [Clonostachys rhizophaga]|uniref:EthD domain-containing protein n=1 Tax=Clonostachys rhizophaga TaxID=160324 RepID=A0A9N9YU00_9HYPO|nr:unnamed protein product [Clonostachys rhizophaga]